MALFLALKRPVTFDSRGMLARVADDDAVLQAIRELMDTVPGERPMRPTWGCLARTRLFEPNSDILVQLVRDDVRDAIVAFEPRVEVVSSGATLVGPRGLRAWAKVKIRALGRTEPVEAAVDFQRGT